MEGTSAKYVACWEDGRVKVAIEDHVIEKDAYQRLLEHIDELCERVSNADNTKYTVVAGAHPLKGGA